MNKKKRDRKHGQITIFIILGLVILFVAIFMFQLAKETQIGKLEEAQEKVISRTFKKEGLRLYVEDCLSDELEEGLIKLGEQGGKIWKGQPGGRGDFVEWLTGRKHLGEQIFYAITKGTYLPDNTYPCKAGEPPDFCKYKYPNSSIVPGYPIKFGGRELDMRAIEGDLRRFLINRTIWCVENFTKTNISQAIKISTENIEMDLNILSDGIKIEVTYPLTLSLGGEEFFSLAEFDFFYVSDFKKLMEAAVTYPLNLDWSFVDFNYSEESLESKFFTKGKGRPEEKDYMMRESTYKELAIEFEPEEIGGGDWIFKFTPAHGKVIEHKPYTFQFVRQNRPPALDYVERDYCDEDGYDYLVIEGDEEYSDINISLFALDPDEDEVDYLFESKDFGDVVGKNFKVKPTVSGWYNITAIASDGYLSDWQKVRILVDRVMKTDVSLWMPYEIYSTPYEDFLFPEDTYWISNEDPVFINVSMPEKSLTADNPFLTSLEYSSEAESFPLGIPSYNDIAGKTTCYSLPWTNTHINCDVSDYTNDELENWPDKLEDDPDFGHFRNTGTGTLSLNFAITYCGKNEQSDSKEVTVLVKQCVPHKNASHPWAWPYHGYIFTDYNFSESFEKNKKYYSYYEPNPTINPFLATHSCCDVNWELRKEGKVCFESPVPDCDGKIPGWTVIIPEYGGYILEQKLDYCDGERGNICGGEGMGNSTLWGGELRCGNSSVGCNEVYYKCENNLAWGYVDVDGDGADDGWCHGMMGCDKVCPKAVVDVYGLSGGGFWDLNYYALRMQANSDDSLAFYCGCSDYPNGTPCDDNFNGYFDMTCQDGRCCPEGGCID